VKEKQAVICSFSWLLSVFGTYYPMEKTFPESTGLGEAKFPKGFV